MIDDIPQRLDLQYKQPAPEDAPGPDSPGRSDAPHQEAGASSLYGRVGDNMTFHTQGAQKHGYVQLIWNWAWKDLGAAWLGLFRVFLPSRK